MKSKILLGIVLVATLTRVAIPSLLGHPANFSALDATALFCGTYFSRRFVGCLVVLFSVWVGDVFIDKAMTGQWTFFYSGFYWQYFSYILITLLGMTLQYKTNPLRIAYASIAAAVIFFVISNFGVWCCGILYPHTLNGLVTCYIAALPFFKNTMVSDLLFSALFFGCFAQIFETKIFIKMPNAFSR